MNYRRAYMPGGQYFFTVVTANRSPLFQDPQAVRLLRKSFAITRKVYPFDIDAIVVLPDHIHCIWSLPDRDRDFSLRWRLIKTHFSKQFMYGRSMWQKRFWEHLVRDQDDYERHVAYIHYNPIKHGYVTRLSDWQYSSFHKYVREGWLDENWGRVEPDIPLRIGSE